MWRTLRDKQSFQNCMGALRSPELNQEGKQPEHTRVSGAALWSSAQSLECCCFYFLSLCYSCLWALSWKKNVLATLSLYNSSAPFARNSWAFPGQLAWVLSESSFPQQAASKAAFVNNIIFFPPNSCVPFFPLEGTPSPPMQKPKENYFFLLAVFFMGFPILIRNWPASRVGDCPCKHLCLPWLCNSYRVDFP